MEGYYMHWDLEGWTDMESYFFKKHFQKTYIALADTGSLKILETP